MDGGNGMWINTTLYSKRQLEIVSLEMKIVYSFRTS